MRLLFGIVYFPHGAQRMLGWFGGSGFQGSMAGFRSMGMPPFLALMAICAEFFGSLGLIFGLFTRVAALGIGIEMFVAVLLVHIHVGFFMNWTGRQRGEGFEFHILVFALAIALAAKGGGAFSVDRALSGNTPGLNAARAQ